MPGQSFSNQRGTPVSLVTTAETAVLTVDGVTVPGPGRTVLIRAYFRITSGAGTTGLTARVRQSADLTGVSVGIPGVVQLEVAAGSSEDHEVLMQVAPGEIAGQSFTLSVQQTAATGNGSIDAAFMEIVVQ